jgi:uncharacterized repeat protein (TIGR03803 family)
MSGRSGSTASTELIAGNNNDPPAQLTTLYSFSGISDGDEPESTILIDSAGDLFGTTAGGGADNEGTVFELKNMGSGTYTLNTLLTFTGANGEEPAAGLVADPNGNLFGTTEYGGANGDGTVFELHYTSPSTAYTFNTLANFNWTNGVAPEANLFVGAGNNLFGTAGAGPSQTGEEPSGVVFELPYNVGTYGSLTDVTTFYGASGVFPNGAGPNSSGVIADANGDLFGTTWEGGSNNDGTVFEATISGSTYTLHAIASFQGGNLQGAEPEAGLIMDASGDLFGTTYAGGGAGGGDGTVFELQYTGPGTGYNDLGYTLRTIAVFGGSNGANPEAGLITDADGDLFGTTADGAGAASDGTVFELQYTGPGAGYNGLGYTLKTVVAFNGTNGDDPQAGLTANAAGDLFGTTYWGGTDDSGTVFEITNSGYAPCYCAGARLLTERGLVAVERLQVGDLLLTAANGLHPIRWLGHRRVDCRRHPKPRDVWPVRIHRHAFGPDKPHCDLLLSPDHSVFIDGVLIPIHNLLNGATIVQEPADDVTYWHVELARHDVLLAEGLPCESYLDTGNRGAFENGGPVVQMHPDFALSVWQAKACAPLVIEGAELEAARSWLLERAAALGHATTDDPDLWLVVAGRQLRPEIVGRLRQFRLPVAPGRLRLVSRSFVPAEALDDSTDHRRLGVAVARVVCDGRVVPLADPRLGSGWHEPEPGGGHAAWRWTDGDAELAFAGVRTLAFELTLRGRYWLEGESAAAGHASAAA